MTAMNEREGRVPSPQFRVRVEPIGLKAMLQHKEPLDFECDELLLMEKHSSAQRGKPKHDGFFCGTRGTMMVMVAMVLADMGWTERMLVLWLLVRGKARIKRREVPPDA